MRAERDDGAVLRRDGVIADIGPAAELMGKHPEVPVLGGGRQVMLRALSMPTTISG
jgi:hypothetical protein